MRRDHLPKIEDLMLTRREMLHRCGMGMGASALAGLMAEAGLAGPAVADNPQSAIRNPQSLNPLESKTPQFPGKAKRVIHLFMNGGPSQVDTFDPKPELSKRHGQPLPMPNRPTERKTGAAFGSPFKFKKYGQSGIEVSDLFAKTAQHVDDMCIIRSMHADVPNHEPSLLLMNCGEARLVRPSFGSWLTYGLGTENQNLPGFIVMCPGGYPIQESQNWQSAFLPGVFQGTYIDTAKTDIEKLVENIRNNFEGLEQRQQLDLLRDLNGLHAQQRAGQGSLDPQLESRIQSFELAYRMQMDATDAFDVSREPEYIREMYGPGVQARSILIARRLLE
jgi:hypothetical protein